MLLQTSTALAAQVTLAWDPSTSPDSEVAGYRIHYGVASRNYSLAVDAGKNLSYPVSGLLEGVTYYFAVAAYDAQGLESSFSNEVCLLASASGSTTATVYEDGEYFRADRWSVSDSEPAGAFVTTVFDSDRPGRVVALSGPLMDNGSFKVADFDGDGKADILWWNRSTGAPSVWLMDGTTIKPGGALLTAESDSEIVAVADFDGDGKADILWRNWSTGAVSVWLMNGTGPPVVAYPGTAPLAWQIIQVADFDGDGKADILWRLNTNGMLSVWLMNGAWAKSVGYPGTLGFDWQIIQVADFDGDGKADILWRNWSTGALSIWLMNGAQPPVVADPGTAESDSEIIQIADFDGDGKADILWRNWNTGALSLWLMDGATVTPAGSPGTVQWDSEILQVADFNADHKADILWQNRTIGTFSVWLMDGATVTAVGHPGIAATYYLRNADGSGWNNSTQFVAKWSMKYSESFAVEFDVETSVGHRYMRYLPVDGDQLGSGEDVSHGLGAAVANGQWQTFVRDLQADLTQAQPGVTILKVNGFLITGSGEVDDIQLWSKQSLPADSDRDGITDAYETTTHYGTDPAKADTDGDGMPDGWEVVDNLAPLTADAFADADGDGFSNLREYLAGTDPQNASDTPRYAITIYVDSGNTSGVEDGTWSYPFHSIQEGIDVAGPGDWVFVRAGSYGENVLLRKDITLIGEGAGNTIVDGTAANLPVIRCVSTAAAEIMGFHIQNGTGAGIQCDQATVSIQQNIISNTREGDGIEAGSGSSLTIANNVIYSNGQAGIAIEEGASATIVNNTVVSNALDGIWSFTGSGLVITNNIIASNGNYGIACTQTPTPQLSYNDV
jgi:parallel beta-helix repeat protein